MGRVFIVTGGYSGVGYELSRMTWQRGGIVYIAGSGLRFLKLALDDLASIRNAADKFLAEEKRLDVLFNNVGVAHPPVGSVLAQGHESTLATKCLGLYLLTKLLSTLRISMAKLKGKAGAAVRVTFTTTMAALFGAPDGGIDLKNLSHPSEDLQVNYALSKTGNWLLANLFAEELGSHGVVSVAVNPANVKSPVLRYLHMVSGFSPDITVKDGGRWVESWGRFHPSPRADILKAMKTKKQGGTGQGPFLSSSVRR